MGTEGIVISDLIFYDGPAATLSFLDGLGEEVLSSDALYNAAAAQVVMDGALEELGISTDPWAESASAFISSIASGRPWNARKSLREIILGYSEIEKTGRYYAAAAAACLRFEADKLRFAAVSPKPHRFSFP